MTYLLSLRMREHGLRIDRVVGGFRSEGELLRAIIYRITESQNSSNTKR
jgi:hypothetical protein